MALSRNVKLRALWYFFFSFGAHTKSSPVLLSITPNSLQTLAEMQIQLQKIEL